MNSHLNSINQSSTSLKTLYFRPNGIFTNALLTKPDITMLLRDADGHENSLYRVDPEIKDVDTEDRPVVVIPSISQTRDQVYEEFDINEQNGYDVDVLCETVIQLLQKYPIRSLDEVHQYKHKWVQLQSEILQLEETLERQRRQLYNVTSEKKTALELIKQEEELIKRLEEDL